MPTVLVTGGAGLFGRGIKAASETRKDGDWKYVWLSSKDADLRNYGETKKLFEQHKPTHVVSLAARVGGLFANMNDQIGFFKDNMAINDTVITLCHEFKVQRAVFCLSTCILPADAPLPLTESVIHAGPPHFSNEGYAMAKRMLECQVRFYREKFAYDWICVVPTNLYGPGDNYNLQVGWAHQLVLQETNRNARRSAPPQEAHVIPALLHKAYLAKKKGEALTVAGSGTPLRQFLHSQDAGEMVVRLLEAPKEKLTFSSVILCADQAEEYSIKQVAETLVAAMGGLELTFDASKADGVFRKTASNKVLRDFIGSEYKFKTLQEGMPLAAKWFVDNFDTCRR